jgi:hypothetical protein
MTKIRDSNKTISMAGFGRLRQRADRDEAASIADATSTSQGEPPMNASLTAAPVVFAALLIGCSQPDSLTSPTFDPLRRPSTTTTGAGAISPAIAGEVVAGRIATAQDVPFKGRLEGAFTVTFDPPPSPFFSVLLEGTGNATLLGRFTVEAPHRVNSATGNAIGSFAFRAANGDMLTADFTGASSPTPTPGVFAVVETATITGGTGRFAGATGSFIVERLVDLGTLSTTGSFEGTISSPGAGER